MARRARGWATAAIIGLAGLAIFEGVMIAGGPAQGRAERRDDIRRGDLARIENHLYCLTSERNGVLSPRLDVTEVCPLDPIPADPETGLPYRIEQIDERNLRLCADFDIPQTDRPSGPYDSGGFDSQGCRVMNLPEDRPPSDR